MSNIERWWLVMDSHEAPYAVRSTKGSADNYARNLNAACTVREVVPAEQLRVAVDLIEQARGAVTYALRCPGHPWHDSDEARKWLMAADHLGRQ